MDAKPRPLARSNPRPARARPATSADQPTAVDVDVIRHVQVRFVDAAIPLASLERATAAPYGGADVGVSVSIFNWMSLSKIGYKPKTSKTVHDPTDHIPSRSSTESPLAPVARA